jgi:hypothetical protein
VVGSIVCRVHAGTTRQAIRVAGVRLTIAELLKRDPRPIRAVLTDAVHIADSAMLDLESAVVYGDTSVDVLDRLVESAKYTTVMATAALARGLPLDNPVPAGMVTLDAASQVIASATMAMAVDLVSELLPLRTAEDVRYRDSLFSWCRDRMRAVVAGGELPPLPVKPEVVEAEIMGAGGHDQGPVWRSESGTIDAEVVTEEDDDVVTEEDQRLLDEYKRLTGREWVDVG